LFNIKIEKGERRPSSWGRAVSFFHSPVFPQVLVENFVESMEN
jgi:hypothetical protein